jgi:hypothetical protein
MTDAMTDVSDERLAELIYLREQMIKISGGDSFDGLDTLDAFRELQRRRASDDAKDAKRYRWLRDLCDGSPNFVIGARWYPTPKELDAAIDAAIDSSMGAEHG